MRFEAELLSKFCKTAADNLDRFSVILILVAAWVSRFPRIVRRSVPVGQIGSKHDFASSTYQFPRALHKNVIANQLRLGDCQMWGRNCVKFFWFTTNFVYNSAQPSELFSTVAGAG
jgi:hypothetical protein